MSLRKAINDKCRDCIWDPTGRGTWREQVFMCAVPECPLYSVRPGPQKGSEGRSVELMRQDATHPFWNTDTGKEWANRHHSEGS